MLDSGAEVSLVKQSILPPTWKKTGTLAFSTASGHVLRRPKTLVDVDLGTRRFQLECGVVEDPIISVPLLVGQNVPGVKLLRLMVETAPEELLGWEDLVETRRKRYQLGTHQTGAGDHTGTGDQTETGAPLGVGTHSTPQDAVTPEEKGQPPQPERETEPEEEGPSQVNRLQLVQVLTRAQSRRQQQDEKADKEATKEPAADITGTGSSCWRTSQTRWTRRRRKPQCCQGDRETGRT